MSELRSEEARLRHETLSVLPCPLSGLSPLNSQCLFCLSIRQVALLFCIPPVFVFEWGTLGAGMAAAAAKVGANKFYWDLWMVGAYYHLYNQVRVSLPVLPFASPGVGRFEVPNVACGSHRFLDHDIFKSAHPPRGR